MILAKVTQANAAKESSSFCFSNKKIGILLLVQGGTIYPGGIPSIILRECVKTREILMRDLRRSILKKIIHGKMMIFKKKYFNFHFTGEP
jgi:hypothetical protein